MLQMLAEQNVCQRVILLAAVARICSSELRVLHEKHIMLLCRHLMNGLKP